MKLTTFNLQFINKNCKKKELLRVKKLQNDS